MTTDEKFGRPTRHLLEQRKAPMTTTDRCGPQCDTDAGYQRHRWHGEEPCARSKRAHAAHNRAYRQPSRKPPKPLSPHGTRARYEYERKHYRAGDGPPPCEACLQANADRVAGRPPNDTVREGVAATGVAQALRELRDTYGI